MYTYKETVHIWLKLSIINKLGIYKDMKHDIIFSLDVLLKIKIGKVFSLTPGDAPSKESFFLFYINTFVKRK